MVAASDGKTERRRNGTPAVSRLLADGTMIELVYHALDRTTAFAVWRAGKCTIEPHVEIAGEWLIPFSSDNNPIRHEVVLLPSGPEEYGSKAQLLAELRSFIHAYLDIGPAFETIIVHYVLFSWLYDAFNEAPYLRFQGDFGTGKTRALLVAGSLCYKPFFASGASTVSPLFHILDAFRGTLILDEADFRFSDEKAEIVKILNNGNVKGMPVLRTIVNRSREFDPRAFHVFGPKIVAMRGSYDDRALESRFLSEVMGSEPLRKDVPISLTDNLKSEARTLRNKLLLFRFRMRGAAWVGDDLPVALAPRMRQILVPLLSTIDEPESRATIIEYAFRSHEALIAERGLSTEAQLLEIVRSMAAESDTPALPVGDIAARFAAAHATEYEHPITPRWIGTLLRRRLHLSPYKTNGRYVLAISVGSPLAALYRRYGIEDEPDVAPFDRGHRDVGTSATRCDPL
jgi:hypothetical protein